MGLTKEAQVNNVSFALAKRHVWGRKMLSALLGRYFPGFAAHLRNPVFVVGVARSGKTSLTDMLAAHPDVARWVEANEVWDPGGYPWRQSGCETLPMWYDPYPFVKRWWRDARPRQEEIRAIFGAYQWLCGRSYFLNETPLNTFRIPYLLAIFPDAKFIHVVRDGRAVVHAYAQVIHAVIKAWPDVYRGVGIGSFDELVLHLASFWKANIEEVARQDDMLRLSETRVLLDVTYEDVCADPTAVFERASRFLGLNPAGLATAVTPSKHLENRNYEWRQELDIDLVPRLVAAMEPVLSQRGYL